MAISNESRVSRTKKAIKEYQELKGDIEAHGRPLSPELKKRVSELQAELEELNK